MAAATEWTTPFHGVSHLIVAGKKSHATITDRGTFADLSRWFPGCGFGPTHTMHASADEAKAIGEQWMSEAV